MLLASTSKDFKQDCIKQRMLTLYEAEIKACCILIAAEQFETEEIHSYN